MCSHEISYVESHVCVTTSRKLKTFPTCCISEGDYRPFLGGDFSCHVRPDVNWRQSDVALWSPDVTDEPTGSIPRLRFVWFTANFVHLPPLKSPRKQGMLSHTSHFLQNFIRKFWSIGVTVSDDFAPLSQNGWGRKERSVTPSLSPSLKARVDPRAYTPRLTINLDRFYQNQSF